MLNAKTRKSDDNSFHFDDLFKTMINYEAKIPARVPQFRMSSAPFCSIRTVYEWRDYLNNIGSWSFRGDFYTGIGTATHSNIQKWLPLVAPAQILGHWRCLHCCKNPYSEDCIHCTSHCKLFVEASVGPQICPSCGRHMVYQEFQYLLPGIHASGHSDGVLLYDLQNTLGISEITEEHIPRINKLLKSDKIKFPAYILEYKTTSKNRALYLDSPLPHHKAQATMYASAGRKIFPEKYHLTGLDIKGIIIKYISRDTPEIKSRDFLVDVSDDSYYDYNVKMIKRATRAIYRIDEDLIFPKKLPCSNLAKYTKYYEDCPYKEECADIRTNKKLIRKLLKTIHKPFKQELKSFEEKFHHPE